MNKYNRVKNNIEFNNIINKGKDYKNNYFVIYVLNNELNKYRFGITVGKKIGNAVLRNKLKRRLRAIVDLNKKNYQINKDYIIIIRKSCVDADFNTLNSNFVNLINYINKGENNEKKE